MFQRYTEKARRVIFFARYEASQYASPLIETEHILLGILREDGRVARMLPSGAVESIRAQIDARTELRQKGSVNIDLPLSNASKRVLAYGAEESERLNHRHIGTEHLLMGLFREEGCLAAEILQPFGVGLGQLRKKFEGATEEGAPGIVSPPRYRGMVTPPGSTITIHGMSVDLEYVRSAVRRFYLHNWHWQKTSWKAQDCVTERKSGRASLDLTFGQDSTNFELVKGGWKKDHCAICRWELFESDDTVHGLGYTNGRDWVCLECYDKFWHLPDFIAGSYSDIT